MENILGLELGSLEFSIFVICLLGQIISLLCDLHRHRFRRGREDGGASITSLFSYLAHSAGLSPAAWLTLPSGSAYHAVWSRAEPSLEVYLSCAEYR